MGWVVTVRVGYDKDSKKHTGVPTGTVTRETKKRFTLRGLHRIGTALYQGCYATEREARLAAKRVAARLFELGPPVVDLDHCVMSVYKADQLPLGPAGRVRKRPPTARQLARTKAEAAEDEAKVSNEEALQAQADASDARDEATKARENSDDLERAAAEAKAAKERKRRERDEAKSASPVKQKARHLTPR